MNANDMLDIIGDIKGAYVLEAQRHREEQGRKRSKLTLLLVAAMISVLLTGCAVAYVLSLEDMTITVQDYTDEFDTQPDVRKVLSLQGVVGTNNYNAAKEWYEFDKNYVEDYKTSVPLTEEEQWKYYAYNCINREKADKVDEIAAKYGLNLHGKVFHFQDGQEIYQFLGIEDIFREGVETEAFSCAGYFFQEGSFKLEGTAAIKDSPWPHNILFSYRCTMKNVFDHVVGFADEDSFQQWTYTTRDGADLLLVLEASRASIYADRQDAFVTLSLQDWDNFGQDFSMDRGQLEALAELFDLSIYPKPLDEAQVEAVREQEKLDREKWREEHPDPWAHPDYAGYADMYLWGVFIDHPVSDPDYTIRDINGDGVEDLLIYRDGMLECLVTMADGVTVEFSRGHFSGGSLCRDNCFLERSFDIDNGWEYVTITRYNGILRPEFIKFMVKKSDGIWYDCPSMNPISEEAYDTPLTGEQYQNILDDYPVIDPADLDLKPLKDLAAEAE